MANIQENISTAVDTALASGLADINMNIAELEAQIGGVATTEDLDSIIERLAELGIDLRELLENNNIFTGDLVINSEASLEFAETLKNRVGIINGSVFIEQSTDMDGDRLQAVAGKIKTITGDLVVRAQASSVSGITLDSLAGVSNLKIAQPGSISFPLLTSVQEIILGENFKVDGEVNFSSLKSVGKISSGNLGDATNVYNEYEVANQAANTINAPKASSINFGMLTHYSPRNLTINGDDDTELHLSALETKDANGKDRSYTITVKGAQALDAPGLVLGSITVGALKNDFDATAAEDLVSATLTMDAKDKKADFTGLDDLETVSIEGKVKTVILSENNNLTDLMLSAAIESLTIHATNLVEAALDYTNANAEEKGALTLTNNDDLTSFSADQVDGLAHLTITGNSELTTISFDALETLPTKESVKPKVTIGGSQTLANDFNAISIDQDEADATEGGSFTTDAGLDDLKTYLTEAKKRVGSDLKVYFDRADEYSIDGEEQTAPSGGYVIGGSHDSQLAVINYAGQSGAVKSKRSWVLDSSDSSAPQGEVFTLIANGLTKSTQALTATGILNAFNAFNDDEFKSAFDPVVGTMTVSLGAYPELFIRLDDDLPASSTVTHTITSSVESATYFELKIGDQSSKVYFTTTDDTSNDDEIISEDGKSITLEVVVAEGALTTKTVLDELSRGILKLFNDHNAPFFSTENSYSFGGYDVLTLGSGDASIKYHNSDKAKVSINTNYAEDGSRSFNGGVDRDRLYGLGIQVTLEAKTAGPSISEGGPSEIGNPPTSAEEISSNDGSSAGEAQFFDADDLRLVELSLNPDGDADNEDSPDYVAFGKEGEEGTDIDHISWL